MENLENVQSKATIPFHEENHQLGISFYLFHYMSLILLAPEDEKTPNENISSNIDPKINGLGAKERINKKIKNCYRSK